MLYLHINSQLNSNKMTKQIIYKGAYLSGKTGDTNRKWILVIWQNGSQCDRFFGDLHFWAQRQCVQQGFSK